MFGAMLGGMAGGDAIEIVVALRDLSSAGFTNLERKIGGLEARANATNFSGFSKAAKTAAKDAEEAAGAAGGGKGVAALDGAFLSLPAALGIAGAAVAGFAVATSVILPAWDKVEQQQKQLAVAAKDHKIALSDLTTVVDASAKSAVQYGFNIDDVRGAYIKLTEVGLTLQQQQQALPEIMDLARAKNIDLGSATTAYTSALFGNARALKQFGIILPPVSSAMADMGAATDKVHKAHEALTKAQENLILVEQKLAGKHHLTTAEAFRLRDAHQKVTDAEHNLKVAQEKLTVAQQGGVDKGARLLQLNRDLNVAIGGQAGTTTDIQVAQAKLNDAWEGFVTEVGPGLEDMLAKLIGWLSTLVDDLTAADKFLTKWDSTMTARPTNTGNAMTNALNSVINKYEHTTGAPIGGSSTPTRMAGHSRGGWVGLYGPELGLFGENGPEYVTPNDRLPAAGGGSEDIHVHVYLDGEQIYESVSRRQGTALALAGTSSMYASGN